MSSRQRRLAAKKEDTLNTPLEVSEESSDEALQAASNPYELLDELHHDPTPVASNEDDEVQEQAVRVSVESRPVSKKTRRRKNKSKKKEQKKGDDDLDRIIKEIESLDVKNRCNLVVPTAPEPRGPVPSIFAVSLRSLRGDEELNRLFGARVVASVEADLRQEQRHDPRRRENSGNRHGTRRFIRTFVLTEPQPDWISGETALKMIQRGPSDDDGEMYEYVATEDYQSIHTQFVECQDLGDPHMLGAFIGSYPFHVESLLAMHDVLMTTGSHLQAEECLNRALFSLESVWHRRFTPASGRCRLDYEVELNRLLFTALFSHIQHLGKRGCLKTAFECCKFLLGLDATDPMGTLCMIDYLSIRAGQFQFIEELVEKFPDGPSIAIRPGIAFSLAFCKLKRDQNNEAMESLIQAVLMHPVAIVRLVNKLKNVGVRMDVEWESHLKERFFARATDGGSSSLGHLVNLFVERHHMLYKAPEILAWLLSGVRRALECVTQGESFQGVTVDDWICVRTTAFPPDSRNHFRHLHLYNFSDDIDRVPEDVLRGGGDGDGVAMERRMAEEIERHGGMAGVVRLGEEDLRNANPLMVFLRSLLPWVQADQQNNPERGRE